MRYAYRRDLPHYQSDDRTYTITFVTIDRRVLPEQDRDIVLHHIVFEHMRRVFLHVAVVMPEHVHMLATPLRDLRGSPYPLNKVSGGIKGSSARSINRVGSRIGHIWQHESFDHELRRDESFARQAEYICMNPVRRGLVDRPDDYRWLWREWIDAR